MSVVKLKKENQKRLKTASKIIYIFASIMKVLCVIGAIALFVVAVILPVIKKDIKITDQTIEIFGEEVKYEKTDDKVIIRYQDNEEEFVNQNEVFAFNKMLEVLEDNNLTKLVILVEIALVTFIGVLIAFRFVFKHLHDLFKNIYQEGTPFTMENVGHIRKISIILISTIVLPFIIGTLIDIIFKLDLNLSINLINLIVILCISSLSYIFEYGYGLQLDSNGKIYGEEDE